jgi:hypothetical protein
VYVLAFIALSSITGCATQTDLIQHGNLKVQFTQTQNQWAENVVIVSKCDKLEKGYCPADSPTEILVVGGKLPGVVSGVASNATTLGSAALIRDGLIKGKASVKQSNQTDIRASTVNPK